MALPTTIVDAMKAKVKLVETVPTTPGAGGETDPSGGTVEIRILAASMGVARTGCDLGRKVRSAPPGSIQSGIMGTIYHEMTHAWFDLLQDPAYAATSPVQSLFAQGTLAYKSATGVNNTDFSDQPAKAFSEAAAYYVDDRVDRWFAALSDLDFLWSMNPTADDPALVAKIIGNFDQPKANYGKIYHDGAFEEIATPLSDELRAAINEKVLDGLPLGMPFAQTPLSDLSHALLGRPLH
jgi:hypothetical protein